MRRTKTEKLIGAEFEVQWAPVGMEERVKQDQKKKYEAKS